MTTSKTKPRVILAGDHAGFRLKEAIAAHLRKRGYEVFDFGAETENPSDDYPDYVIPAAEAVAKSKRRAVGIVFGGSGLGECLAANKVRGIRAVAAYDEYTARMSRLHNDANVLSLGGRTAAGSLRRAKRIVDVWLATPFSGEARHRRRLRQVAGYEKGLSS